MKNTLILLTLVLSTYFSFCQNTKYDSILSEEINCVKLSVMIGYIHDNAEIESVKDWIVNDQSGSTIFQNSVFPPVLFNKLNEYIREHTIKNEEKFYCPEKTDLVKCNLIYKAYAFSKSEEIDNIIHQSIYLDVAKAEIKKKLKLK